jgi:soluble lytic murein transglycosylase
MYTKIVHRKHRGTKLIFFSFSFALFFIIVYYLYRHYDELFLTRTNYQQLIEEAAIRHDMSPLLLKAVIWQESRFKANIVGSHKEIGLMQIRPNYGAVTDWEKEHNQKIKCKGILFNPELNIEIGAWYLGRALKRWNTYKHHKELALSEYNAGLKGMRPWIPSERDGKVISRITIPSTKEYVSGIIRKYNEYKAEDPYKK